MARCAACGTVIDNDFQYCPVCEEFVEPITEEEYQELFGDSE